MYITNTTDRSTVRVVRTKDLKSIFTNMNILAARYIQLFRRKKKNRICKLPDVALLNIIEYLGVNEILRLRLTCSRLYVLCNGSQFFQRVKINCYLLYTYKSKKIKDFLETHESHLSLDLRYFGVLNLNLLLPNIVNVECLGIEVRYLQDICDKCWNLRKLEIYLVASSALIDDSSHLLQMDATRHFSEKIDFTCLSKLHQLDELVFKVITSDGFGKCTRRDIFARWHLKPTLLFDILSSTKAITKISFLGQFFICGRLKLEQAEFKTLEAIEKFFKNLNRLKSWHLQAICNEHSEYTVMFPQIIKELYYRDDCVRSRLDHSACKGFLKLENLVNIEKLVIDHNSFLRLSAVNFPSLLKLEIYQYFTYFQLDVIDSKAISLPQLKHLRLNQVYAGNIRFYKPLFTPNLETLTLDTEIGVTDALLSYIFNNCIALRELSIVLNKSSKSETKISGSLLKSMVTSSLRLKIRFSKFLEFDVVLSSKSFDEHLYRIRKGITII